jgi:glycosyltransferase involved in cell wall biosynthesis
MIVPRFSVVVPAYNEAGYLGRTLASLQAQDYPGAYEIIVVDNNSDDETSALARSFGVRVVPEPRAGVCAARQRGADCTTGEIIVSTDADTEHPADWLRTIDATFASSESVIAVAGPCRYEHARGWTRYYPELLFGLVSWVFRRTGRVSYVSATNLAVRRTAFPGYDLNQTQGGDELDLLRRLRPVGTVVWDPANVVTTSARRLQRGFVYNFFVTFLIYYLLAYALNRFAGRPRLGMAPAFRHDISVTVPSRRMRVLLPVLAAFTAGSTLAIAQFHLATLVVHLLVTPFH